MFDCFRRPTVSPLTLLPRQLWQKSSKRMETDVQQGIYIDMCTYVVWCNSLLTGKEVSVFQSMSSFLYTSLSVQTLVQAWRDLWLTLPPACHTPPPIASQVRSQDITQPLGKCHLPADVSPPGKYHPLRLVTLMCHPPLTFYPPPIDVTHFWLITSLWHGDGLFGQKTFICLSSLKNLYCYAIGHPGWEPMKSASTAGIVFIFLFSFYLFYFFWQIWITTKHFVWTKE